MTNELKPCPVSDEMLVELIRAHSDPPLCRVCGEPLSFGAADHTGTKWAHYVRAPIDERTGERPLWHQPTQDHIDASYRYNPQPNPIVVRVAQELLERRQSRPSPAPTVSVEECAQAFWLARNAHESSDDPDAHGIAAVHALCVSRLTGAATRSETIEECAKVCDREALDDEERASQYGNGSTEQIELLHMAMADRVCARLIRDLASHPASVAGEARPSDTAWSLCAEAEFHMDRGDWAEHEADWLARWRKISNHTLYERGAK